jgi:uncharacterized tellurite resistance protein B-like protein
LKIGLYASAWSDLERKIVERLQLREITRNISLLFASTVKYEISEESIPNVIDSVAEQTVSHPTDSHPPTAVRISELRLSVKEIERDLLIMPSNTCVDLFDEPNEIEESLTELQQQYYAALGAQVPDESQADVSAVVIAAFGAQMVVADGKVEPEEIDEAESIGRSLSAAFDYIDFREYCHYPDTIPALDKLLEASEGVDDEGKSIIFDYMKKIAGSDGDISPEESSLLERVRATFKLPN